MPSSNPVLHVLYRGLVLIRYACQAGNLQRAEAIADALHNLPLLIEQNFVAEDIIHMYLDPLVQEYPDLEELRSEFAARYRKWEGTR